MPVLNRVEFKKLFDLHFKHLRNYIYYRCGDSELATDIAQDVFMKIWEKKLDVYKNQEMGLMTKIANDLIISSYRKIKNGQNFKQSITLNNQVLNPEDEMFYSELKERYELALKNMNENQRVVFLLNRTDGLKYAEIADMLGISIKAVEKRMSNALEYFRDKLL